MENLENIIESILFCSGDAIEKSLIKEKLGISESEINKAIKILEEKYNDNSGIRILKFKNKLQFSSNSKYTDSVDSVLKKTRERALSKTIIETAAIIAYKQPITRLEIEEIRGGAQADYAIRSLLEHKLIEVVGRKETLGRPLLFGTTDEFLKRFNLESLKELPDYNDLMAQVKELNTIGENASLYKDYDVSDEEIVSQEDFVTTVKENIDNIERIKTNVKEDLNRDNDEKNLVNDNPLQSDITDEEIVSDEEIEETENNEDKIISDEDVENSEDYNNENSQDEYIILPEIKEFKKH